METTANEAAASPITPWSPALRLLTIGALVTIVASAFETLAVATVMPRVVDDLGGLRFYGWVFSTYTLANIIGLTVAGAESDRSGPGRPYAVGIVLFVTGLLVAGLAPSMLVLIAGRAIQGFGGGMLYSTIYVVVGRAYPEAAKPRMLALMASAWVVPGLMGPVVAGLIADFTHWRVIFLGLLPFMGMAALLAYPRIRTIGGGGKVIARDWRRYGRATTLSLGATALFAGLGASNLLIALPLVVAGGMLAVAMLRRLWPAGTLRAAPGLPAAVATMFLLNLGFFGVDSFVPLALTDIRGRSVAFAGIALTAATVAWSTGSWLQAHYAASRSRRLVVGSGLLLIMIGSAGTMLTLFDQVSVWLAPIAWGVAGLGMGLGFSGISLTVLQTAEAGREGAATSSMQLASTLGFGVGAGIGGAWIAALSDGEHVNRSALVAHDLVMIGILALALVIVRNIPAWPGRKTASGNAEPAPVEEPVPALVD